MMAGNYLPRDLGTKQIPGRRQAMGENITDVLQSTASSTSYSTVVQVGTLLQFPDQWKSITSYNFVLNIFKDHHLQLRCHPV